MQRWASPLLLAMSYFGRPSFGQSSVMEVVTLPPPTTQAAPAAATASTPDVVPSVLYPAGNPILNNIDSLALNYITPWNAVDLTVSCGATVDDPNSFSFKTNNLPQNGPHDLSPIQQSFDPTAYPIYCHITLEDSANSQNLVDGGQFIMTTALSASASNAASGTRTGTGNTASSTSSSAQTGTAANESSNNTAAPGLTSADTSSSGGLSSGAKAGIAISILLFLAFLGLFIFLLLRYRRKLQKTQSELHETQASAAAAVAAHRNEKAYLDSILKAAGKPDTSHGGRIVVADLGSRQSGDWRQFFASKASSAKQAISSVGSRGNSRPGSRRASRLASMSRPGTSGEEDIPGVPSLPSPSLAGSMRGDGSTVGLVNSENDSEGPKKPIKRKPLPVPR